MPSALQGPDRGEDVEVADSTVEGNGVEGLKARWAAAWVMGAPIGVGVQVQQCMSMPAFHLLHVGAHTAAGSSAEEQPVAKRLKTSAGDSAAGSSAQAVSAVGDGPSSLTGADAAAGKQARDALTVALAQKLLLAHEELGVRGIKVRDAPSALCPWKLVTVPVHGA